MIWYYNNRPISSIEDLPDHENLYGFVYRITNLQNGLIYIGKKNFYTNRKRNLPKKELSGDKRRKTYKRVIKESNWLVYHSSCIKLLEDYRTSGRHIFKKEILFLCRSKIELTATEIEQQFIHQVLRRESYNDNIMGRFFRKTFNYESKRNT